jgi:DNA-binding HxlR family transcriptional regulator
MKELVLEHLSEGPKSTHELLEVVEWRKRTLTKVLKELCNENLIKRLMKGVYAFYSFVPLEEAVKRIRSAVEELFFKYEVVRLEDIAQEAMIGASQRWGKITFSDIAFAEAREVGLRIGSESVERRTSFAHYPEGLRISPIEWEIIIKRARELVNEANTPEGLASVLAEDSNLKKEFEKIGSPPPGLRAITLLLRKYWEIIKPPQGEEVTSRGSDPRLSNHC